MNNSRVIITILILVIALVGIGWFLSAKGMLPGIGQTGSAASGWHAVFLTNGQVYFGKMEGRGGQYVTLKDIYYIQVQQQQQEGQQDQQQEAQISLVKLGNELHGPVDEMTINRDHILFFEEMKNDAKVVDAIEEYKKNGPQQPAAAPTTSPAASSSPTNSNR